MAVAYLSDVDANPVVPVVTGVATYHGGAIILLATSRTNPDLGAVLVNIPAKTDDKRN